MEEETNRVVSPQTEVGQAEERMLGADLVREITARRERGEGRHRRRGALQGYGATG